MKLVESYAFLEKLEEFLYELLELRDRKDLKEGTTMVKLAFPSMLKGGVIMDVTNQKQAEVAEEAGAIAVMVLDKLPYDVRKSGGVARSADIKTIEDILSAVTIPVSAKCRIGHYQEAKLLEEVGVDLIDESEVLTPVDDKSHINKKRFKVPFVNGARSLPEALRRIGEGSSMIRTKGEAGTGDVAEAVKHMKATRRDIRLLRASFFDDDELIRRYSKRNALPYELALLTARLGRLPVVHFAAGGIVTPADAALMMWLGSDGIFVGSGIFKSEDPERRAEAIVLATSRWDDPQSVLEAQRMVMEGLALPGLDIKNLKPEDLLQIRGD
ncbi:MAG: pyridoxal 5'-phosphate synthase lyase subunit PdxS [Candidatus Methanomethyliaceae archaeon]